MSASVLFRLKRMVITPVLLFTGYCLLPAITAQSQVPLPDDSYIPGEVLIGVRPEHDDARLTDRLANIGTSARRFMKIHGRLIKLRAEISVPEAIAVLKQLPEIVYAEPNYIGYAASNPVPNDIYH